MNLSSIKLSLIFLLFLIVQNAAGQERKDYQLLWEIEHKNSSKKSYIFGTMHVKDERAFSFSDAVIPAIQNSEAFAMQIHPDSIGGSLSSEMFESKEENIYKRILSSEEYQRLADKFKEKTGKSLDSTAFRTPMYIKSSLEEDIVSETDKRTFLDGYLYGMAYNLDKDIYGLEQLEDQMPMFEGVTDEEIRENILAILDADPSESKDALENLIKLYYEGDIYKLYYASVGLFTIDEILDKRNIVMANGIEDVMGKDTSIFAAVGAAHLAGNKGLIKLMTERGFKVNLVPATFTKTLKDYPITPNLKKWQSQEDLELGYSVSTPNMASPLAIAESFAVNISIDLIFGGAFGYMAIDMRGKGVDPGIDMIQRIVDEQTNNQPENIIKQSQKTKNGVLIKDIKYYDKDNKETRMQVAYHNEILYSFFVQHDLEQLDGPYVNAFFDSVKFFEPKQPKAEWSVETNRMAAYQVHVPGAKTDASRELANPIDPEGEPFFMDLSIWQDPANEMIYILRHNTQPLGYYMDDKSALVEDFQTQLGEKGTILEEPKPFKANGYEGYETQILLQNKYHAYVRIIFRGNRTYVIMAQSSNPDKKVSLDNYFFNSFKLTPIEYQEFKNDYKIEDRYTIKMPEKVSMEIDSSYYSNSGYDKAISHFGKQEGSGALYAVVQTTFKPYFRLETEEKLFQEVSESYLEEGDTITRSNNITIAGMSGKEFLIEKKDSDVQQLAKMFADGNSVISLYVYTTEDEIDSNFSESYFKSFKVLKKDKTFDITAPKLKELLKNLKSKDSLERIEAEEGFEYIISLKDDEKLLRKGLAKSYFDEPTTERIKKKILRELCIIGDLETLEFLKSYYLDANSTNNERITILENIYLTKSENTVSTYLELLKNSKPRRVLGENFDVFNMLHDSIPIFMTQQPIMKELLDVDDYRDKLLSFYTDKIVSDSIMLNTANEFRYYSLSHFKEDAKKYVDTVQRNNSDFVNYSLIYNYLDIAEVVNEESTTTKEALKTLYSMENEKDWTKTRALILAIKNGHEISNNVLNDALQSLYTRWEVIEALIKWNPAYKIDPVYLKTDEFAKLSLYNAVGYWDDEYPDSITKLGEFEYNGKKYAAYTYSFEQKENALKYHGVCSLETFDIKNPALLKAYYQGSEIATDWQKQSIELMKAQED